jgi:hypothetical protein
MPAGQVTALRQVKVQAVQGRKLAVNNDLRKERMKDEG